jgi:hypothetical protein
MYFLFIYCCVDLFAVFNSYIDLSNVIALYTKELELSLSNEDLEHPCIMGCDVIYYGINVQIFGKELLPQFTG